MHSHLRIPLKSVCQSFWAKVLSQDDQIRSSLTTLHTWMTNQRRPTSPWSLKCVKTNSSSNLRSVKVSIRTTVWSTRFASQASRRLKEQTGTLCGVHHWSQRHSDTMTCISTAITFQEHGSLVGKTWCIETFQHRSESSEKNTILCHELGSYHMTFASSRKNVTMLRARRSYGFSSQQRHLVEEVSRFFQNIAPCQSVAHTLSTNTLWSHISLIAISMIYGSMSSSQALNPYRYTSTRMD